MMKWIGAAVCRRRVGIGAPATAATSAKPPAPRNNGMQARRRSSARSAITGTIVAIITAIGRTTDHYYRPYYYGRPYGSYYYGVLYYQPYPYGCARAIRLRVRPVLMTLRSLRLFAP